MTGASTGGQNIPDNEGAAYGRSSLEGLGEPQQIVPIGTESSSVAILAHPGNNGNVYVGWDSSVDETDGFILQPGASMSLDIDVSQQTIYGVSDEAGDEVRYIATG